MASLRPKDESIKHIVDGAVVYEAMDMKDTAVRVSGNVAVVTGKVDLHQNASGKKSVTNLAVMTVWVKGPQGWKMIGRQATRVPVQ